MTKYVDAEVMRLRNNWAQHVDVQKTSAEEVQRKEEDERLARILRIEAHRNLRQAGIGGWALATTAVRVSSLICLALALVIPVMVLLFGRAPFLAITKSMTGEGAFFVYMMSTMFELFLFVGAALPWLQERISDEDREWVNQKLAPSRRMTAITPSGAVEV